MSNQLEEEEFETRTPSHRSGGTVVVTVLRRDGRPAHGASVGVWRPGPRGDEQGGGGTVVADADGKAQFEGIEPGTWQVGMSAAGLLSASAQITVDGSGSYHATLAEPEGATLEVAVVDERSEPLPCAAVTFYGRYHTAWLDLGAGVQRIDPYTGHDGVRVFDHIGEGRCAVCATWADRSGGTTVHLVNGQRQRVEIVLRPPE